MIETGTARPTREGGVDQAWALVARADVAAADADACASLLDSARRVRSFIAAFEARVSSRINEIAQSTPIAPASDLHARIGGCTAAEGRRKDRRGSTIDQAPGFGDALADGAIAEGHVDALGDTAAHADETVRAGLFERADELLNAAGSMTSTEFGRHVRDVARQLEIDNGIERNTRQRRDTFLSWKLNNVTGMTDGRFSLHPELANQITSALRRKVNAMIAEGERNGDPDCTVRTVNRHRVAAEALGKLLAHSDDARPRPVVADITVIIDANTYLTGELSDGSVCETGDGASLPPETVRRLACSGRITPIIVDQTGKLMLGRTQHPANRHQRRALRTNYRNCAFHGCDVEYDRCELHHVRHWEHGGRTDLGNLIPLCSRHHHVVHEAHNGKGWTIHLAPDRTLTITQPDGNTWATTTPDIPPPGQHRRRERQPAA